MSVSPAVALNDSRAKIKEAMGFALDHSDASADVVDVLKESLLVSETPIHGELVRCEIQLLLVVLSLPVRRRLFLFPVTRRKYR